MSFEQQVIVRRKRLVAERILEIELVARDASLLAPFSAGAHIDVRLGENIVRQYSLCNSPSERDRYLLGVQLETASRGGSRALHELSEGAILDVSKPRNRFPLAEDRSHSVLIAGGIGITPLLSMAEQLVCEAMPFDLHYCVRTRAAVAFKERIFSGPILEATNLYVSDELGLSKFDAEALFHRTLPERSNFYICGPFGFIEHVLKAAASCGVDKSRLHREHFHIDPVLTTDTTVRTFTVKLARSELSVVVNERETIIDALASIGVDVPVSCEQGVCGTCLTTVLSGEPDHRDVYLTDDEKRLNNCLTPCCSRSKSLTLTLDL
ncbi:PDR/VanB family oxidoreductase [Herbaspirillum autotrophicum]|uniref:PDR/VanB family oxidoreductase n=1 Tax=Herbaspirillum autotrophicum TaxID=180195 RepID=UPI00067D17BE|nr:PDR/VanB family oxidoreductase [Herbaspirillum autotrophicum]